MKYPALLGFDAVLPALDDFDAVIDVRSPAEFALDHIPGAVNCPVLDDAERIRVGTMYKQIDAFEARKVGAALVAKNIARLIEERWLTMPRDWKPLIYCWRGGNRSGALAHVLARIGWPAIQLDGGYKAYRAHVGAALALAPSAPLRILCGPTGSGKTRLLGVLEANGAQVLDLEDMAAHRGSVLGELPSRPQPSQKMFETRIWDRLRRCDPARPVFVESESKKIGILRVPDALMGAMRAAPCVALALSRPNRVRLLMEEYAHFAADPATLNARLECLIQLHGGATIRHWQALADGGQMETLVDELLEKHYDPAYRRSLGHNFLLAGQAEELPLAGIDHGEFASAAASIDKR